MSLSNDGSFISPGIFKNVGVHTWFPGKVSRLQDENERLKKNLSSKNEVESKQIEAVRDLSTANAQWEQVAKKTASDLEDARDQVGRKYSFHNISAPSDLLSDCNNLPQG